MNIIFPEHITHKQLYASEYNNKWYVIMKDGQRYMYATLYIHNKNTIILIDNYGDRLVPDNITHLLSPKQILMLHKLGLLHLGLSVTTTEIDQILSAHNLR